MAEMQKGTGPDALPQGAATQLNDSAAPPAQQPDLMPQDIPVQYAAAPKIEGASMKGSENLNILTNPADPNFRPAAQPLNRVPKRVARNLPLLQAASKDPEAPRAIKALYRAIITKLEEEQAQAEGG